MFNLRLLDNEGRKKGTSEDTQKCNVGNGESDGERKVSQYTGGSRFQNLWVGEDIALKRKKDTHSLPFQDRLIIVSGIRNVLSLGGNV